jgi:1-acyl-sn-glycerol-3-phosphate acyltransferase
VWRLLFRLDVVGHENPASAETPNILVVDHVSGLDAPILFSLLETPATL